MSCSGLKSLRIKAWTSGFSKATSDHPDSGRTWTRIQTFGVLLPTSIECALVDCILYKVDMEAISVMNAILDMLAIHPASQGP
jgi:hypothetical protein